MYEKMNVDAMNEAIEDYNKKNFFQKLRIWRNKRSWKKFLNEGKKINVIEHVPVLSPVSAVFYDIDNLETVEIPVLVWQVTEECWAGDRMVDVKGLVPWSLPDLDYQFTSREPTDKTLNDSNLWEITAMRDHGLLFQGYRALGQNSTF